MSINYISGIIHVGNLPLGGHFPIRVQSMTNTDTNDVAATVAQCIRLANAGCEMIRITAQGTAEAKKLQLIKNKLKSEGRKTTLID